MPVILHWATVLQPHSNISQSTTSLLVCTLWPAPSLSSNWTPSESKILQPGSATELDEMATAESSRTINHKLNELLSKSNISKSKLDASTALNYLAILKSNILGKDKQEKVNSIVVLAKLLDCISAPGSEAVLPHFVDILDETLFNSLFSIVSTKMSTETYKAILKIAVISLSGGPYPPKFGDTSIDIHLPLYQSLVTYLDVIDVFTAKLYLSDTKILLNSIRLVNELINKALRFKYDRIITLTGRLKHVKFFSTVGNLIETTDALILEAITALEETYFNLNEYLSKTHFEMSYVSHQVMLTNLFIFLDVSLNEFGTPASTEEYVKAGFSSNPRKFVVDNFTILLAMDLKVFLKDPNITFKKKFHEELIMSDHHRTFPLYLFIRKCTDLWLRIFHQKKRYPRINGHILSWELMIYYSMNNCLLLWQNTKSNLENPEDIEGIIQLLESNVEFLEEALASNPSIEECLEVFTARSTEDIRHAQFLETKRVHSDLWRPRFHEFDRNLAQEVKDFVCEQRVMQLLKGSWVHTESHADRLFKNTPRLPTGKNYYFIILSPNRRSLYYKEFSAIATNKPSYEEMESQSINLREIAELKSIRIGNLVGEADKAKNSMLISVKGTISYEKIILLDKSGKPLLSFYTDSEDNKAVWLDGLKMLKGLADGKHLSAETSLQLTSLQEIRRNTQLLVLEGKQFTSVAPDSEDSDDEDYYDLVELTNVLEGFHFV